MCELQKTGKLRNWAKKCFPMSKLVSFFRAKIKQIGKKLSYREYTQ